jgi:hypothetical protein
MKKLKGKMKTERLDKIAYEVEILSEFSHSSTFTTRDDERINSEKLFRFTNFNTFHT